MLNVEIQLHLYVYTSYVNCEVFKKISLRFTASFIQSSQVVKFNISETKYVSKKLTTDVTTTSKVFNQ